MADPIILGTHSNSTLLRSVEGKSTNKDLARGIVPVADSIGLSVARSIAAQKRSELAVKRVSPEYYTKQVAGLVDAINQGGFHDFFQTLSDEQQQDLNAVLQDKLKDTIEPKGRRTVKVVAQGPAIRTAVKSAIESVGLKGDYDDFYESYSAKVGVAREQAQRYLATLRKDHKVRIHKKDIGTVLDLLTEQGLQILSLYKAEPETTLKSFFDRLTNRLDDFTRKEGFLKRKHINAQSLQSFIGVETETVQNSLIAGTFNEHYHGVSSLENDGSLFEQNSQDLLFSLLSRNGQGFNKKGQPINTPGQKTTTLTDKATPYHWEVMRAQESLEKSGAQKEDYEDLITRMKGNRDKYTITIGQHRVIDLQKFKRVVEEVKEQMIRELEERQAQEKQAQEEATRRAKAEQQAREEAERKRAEQQHQQQIKDKAKQEAALKAQRLADQKAALRKQQEQEKQAREEATRRAKAEQQAQETEQARLQVQQSTQKVTPPRVAPAEISGHGSSPSAEKTTPKKGFVQQASAAINARPGNVPVSPVTKERPRSDSFPDLSPFGHRSPSQFTSVARSNRVAGAGRTPVRRNLLSSFLEASAETRAVNHAGDEQETDSFAAKETRAENHVTAAALAPQGSSFTGK